MASYLLDTLVHCCHEACGIQCPMLDLIEGPLHKTESIFSSITCITKNQKKIAQGPCINPKLLFKMKTKEKQMSKQTKKQQWKDFQWLSALLIDQYLIQSSSIKLPFASNGKIIMIPTVRHCEDLERAWNLQYWMGCLHQIPSLRLKEVWRSGGRKSI